MDLEHSVSKKRWKGERDPQTGNDLMLCERRVVTFKCSGVLREKTNVKKQGDSHLSRNQKLTVP